MALLQIKKLSTKVWEHIADIGGSYVLTKFMAKKEFNKFFIVEVYGSKRFEYSINEIEVYNTGGAAETFTNFDDLFLRLEVLKYTGFYIDGEFTFNPSSYDLSEFQNNEIDRFAKLSDITAGGIPEAPLDGQLYGRQSAAWSLIPTVEASLNTESVTIDNFWNHGSSFNFLRSNSNLAGFNRETLDQSTGSTTIVLADILASSSLYATSRSKYISKVLIDCHGVSGTVNEWRIALRAYQKINTSPFIVNVIDLGEVTFTKGDFPQAFASLTPSVIEIPADYLVTCFLRKVTGTGFDIKAAITFKFDDHV